MMRNRKENLTNCQGVLAVMNQFNRNAQSITTTNGVVKDVNLNFGQTSGKIFWNQLIAIRKAVHMYIWMCVSNDEYELPEIIADTAKQLAIMCNTSENNIRSCVSKYEKGVLKWTRFRKVIVEE